MNNLQRGLVAGAVILVLLIANIIYYVWNDWGLITINVTDAPIGDVVKSIERQGWVTIYSNLPPDTKVTMMCDHVPLQEAMDTLVANVPAHWTVGFFVGPTSVEVKQEIAQFQANQLPDDTKTYNFPSSLQMITDDGDAPAPDPRRETWPGIDALKPDPAVQAAQANLAPGGDPSAPAPDGPPTSVQGYLKAFAELSDAYIVAPGSWDPLVAKAPEPNSSIARAIKSFVGEMHGAVAQAIILRARGGHHDHGPGGGFHGGGMLGGDMDWGTMEARMSNAINGLPEDQQAGARAQLAAEKTFWLNVEAAAPDQRLPMIMAHMASKMGNRDNWRRSPDKRAQMYQRTVSARMAATGK
jgi:hypothetical protein